MIHIPLKPSRYQIEVEKSKFICLLFPINNAEEVYQNLGDVKNLFPDATHYLFSYIFNNDMRYDDDGEPGSIAKNFLSLFKKKNINRCLIIVVRYFGGTKLGASRLSRTYLNLVNDTVSMTEFGELKNIFCYSAECDYPTYNKLLKLRYYIENITYSIKIKLTIKTTIDIKNNLIQLGVKIIDEKIVEGVMK